MRSVSGANGRRPARNSSTPGSATSVFALGTVAVYYLVFILGWIRILAAWEIHVPYRAALQAEMASMLAKYVPGGVWTPAARVAALGRLTGVTAAGTVLASILVEAVLSAISGVLVFVVSLAWVRNADAPLVPLVLFALVCLADPPPAHLRTRHDTPAATIRPRLGRAPPFHDDGCACSPSTAPPGSSAASVSTS